MTTPTWPESGTFSLTSVDPVSRDVGIRCAQLLLERMADPSLPQRTEVLAPHLVVRTAPEQPAETDAVAAPPPPWTNASPSSPGQWPSPAFVAGQCRRSRASRSRVTEPPRFHSDARRSRLAHIAGDRVQLRARLLKCRQLEVADDLHHSVGNTRVLCAAIHRGQRPDSCATRAKAGSRRNTRCCRAPPQAHAARIARAGLPAGPGNPAADRALAALRRRYSPRSANAPSCSIATCCRPTAAPAPRPSPARSSLCPGGRAS